MAGQKGRGAALAAAREHVGDGEPLTPGENVTGNEGQLPHGGDEIAAGVSDQPLDEEVESAPLATGEGDLSEAAHNRAVDRMEVAANEAVIDTRSLVWDLRDAMLDQVKLRPKPWSATSTAEQRDVAAALEHAAAEFVRRAVEMIALGGRAGVRALLTKVTIGDDIVISAKVKMLAAEDEDAAVTTLHHARGKHVMLTLASADDHKENQRAAQTDEEEPGLDFEAGRDEHPADHSDLAEAGEHAAAVAPAECCVYDPEEHVWLHSDEDTWTDEFERAGRWDRGRADVLAEAHNAEARSADEE